MLNRSLDTLEMTKRWQQKNGGGSQDTQTFIFTLTETAEFVLWDTIKITKAIL